MVETQNRLQFSILNHKTQLDEDQTFKYSTKMFVDGVEILPELTRATDTKGVTQFIDKFGQKTTAPTEINPAYILEGKGSPLYKADDLGEATKSTPAMLTGLGLEAFLGDGKTVEIVTDPMQFKRTMEYQALARYRSTGARDILGQRLFTRRCRQ